MLPVIFLMGPTASGKTDMAAALSERFDMDLIGVDAAQVYCGMNIGTAKPDREFLDCYPHQLVDIRQPDQTYSAADFVTDAGKAIAASHARRRIPLLVGGTMFYFSALERGLSALPAANPTLRSELEAEMASIGVVAMHQRLAVIDPELASRIDSHDRQRIQRALEIFSETGMAPSDVMQRKTPLEVPLIKLTLFDSSRDRLHRRIQQRFLTMLEAGLVDEVRDIVEAFPHISSSPSMRIVGYRQVMEYLRGDVCEQKMIDSGIAATRQLAKRQLTWMRQQSGLTWFETGGETTLGAVLGYLRHHPLLQIADIKYQARDTHHGQ